MSSVPPGRYLIDSLFSENSRWTIASAITGGKDIADEPFTVSADADVTDLVITLTDRPAELSGFVIGASGGHTSDAAVLVFSAESRYWTPPSRRIRTLHTDATGKYVLRGLPAGDYLIAALRAVAPNAWEDPAWLRALSRTAGTSAGSVKGRSPHQTFACGSDLLHRQRRRVLLDGPLKS